MNTRTGLAPRTLPVHLMLGGGIDKAASRYFIISVQLFSTTAAKNATKEVKVSQSGYHASDCQGRFNYTNVLHRKNPWGKMGIVLSGKAISPQTQEQ